MCQTDQPSNFKNNEMNDNETILPCNSPKETAFLKKWWKHNTSWLLGTILTLYTDKLSSKKPQQNKTCEIKKTWNDKNKF